MRIYFKVHCSTYHAQNLPWQNPCMWAKRRFWCNSDVWRNSLDPLAWNMCSFGPPSDSKWPTLGLPSWLIDKESSCQCRGHQFHPWSGKMPHAVGQLNLCAISIDPVLWSPGPQLVSPLGLQKLEPPHPRDCAPQREKPPQWEAGAQQPEGSIYSLQIEKSLHSDKDLAQPKINKTDILRNGTTSTLLWIAHGSTWFYDLTGQVEDNKYVLPPSIWMWTNLGSSFPTDM